MKTLKKAAVMLSVTFTFVLGGAVPATPATTVSHARTTHVWIAPGYGTKWHHSKNCRGLSAAGYKKAVSLHWARSHGYRMCKWCR